MMPKDNAKLIAQTDITCELLLALLANKSLSKIDYNNVSRHIEINREILNQKFDILRDAHLVDNHTTRDDADNITNRTISITEEGKQALVELGYNIE